MEKIVMSSDHAGLELKGIIKKHLEEKNFEILDVGTYTADSCDYPDFAYAAACKVKSGEVSKGIVICGTGIGISISANKVKGIRCALCSDMFSAEMARRHNDANMLAMGARVISAEIAEKIVDIFLSTPFEGGRHQNRIEKMMNIESKN